jgi:pantoate--beta-alanine ligase
MRRFVTIAETRAALDPLRRGSIGLVPTMGALHTGHEALFRAARDECDTVVATIFVNPAQFDDPADYEAYAVALDDDARRTESAGVDVLFTPTADEMYPDGYQTWVEVEDLSRELEGAHRPGHFRGVATICTKLFSIVRPDRAYFGQKDAQQTAIVERLVADLALGLEIRVVPTVREEDGLAASSRNARLSPVERAAAAALPRALAAGRRAFAHDEDPVAAAQAVLAEEPLLVPDYVEIAHWNGAPPLLAAAVRAGRTRLIDNVLLEGAAQ